jgi:deleted-in-malignant-brain-tumors protein 1
MSGSGPIYMVNVGCHGNESNLLDCEYDNTTGGCNHGMDVSVICGAAVCDDGDVRLVGGDYPTEGRVEVCLNGVWGTICHDSWDRNDATVICRQLNYTTQRKTNICLYKCTCNFVLFTLFVFVITFYWRYLCLSCIHICTVCCCM